MNDKIQKSLNTAVFKILSKLVRILIHNGVSYQTFSEIAKWTYVDVAKKDFVLPYKKNTQSRISTLTGVRRQDIKNIIGMPPPSEKVPALEYNRAARIISGWIREPFFCDGNGNPRELPLDGRGPSFKELVKRFSGDLHPRTLIDELVRVGAVEMTEKNTVRLLVKAYVPANCQEEKIDILGTDTAQFIATIDHNLRHSETESHLQLKVSSDELHPEALPKLKKIAKEKALSLLQDLDQWMSTHGTQGDKIRSGSKDRVTAGLGVYYFEEKDRS